jgi:hypothetical protein
LRSWHRRDIGCRSSNRTAEKERAMPPRHLTPKRKPAAPAMQRLLVALPKDLHRRIKLSCASRNIPMSEAIREALKHTPWPMEAA